MNDHPLRYPPRPVPDHPVAREQGITYSIVVPHGTCPDLAARHLLRCALGMVEDELGHEQMVKLAQSEVNHVRDTPPPAEPEPF